MDSEDKVKALFLICGTVIMVTFFIMTGLAGAFGSKQTEKTHDCAVTTTTINQS